LYKTSSIVSNCVGTTPSPARTTCCMRTPRPRIHPIIFFTLWNPRNVFGRTWYYALKLVHSRYEYRFVYSVNNKNNFRGSPTDGSHMLRLEFFFQHADCYICFAPHILAAHHIECVFYSETLYLLSI
jgi:hypothetical protein